MAVTFLGNSGGGAYIPSDNPVTVWFSSDQYAQPNFYFLVQVLVNGVLDSEHHPIFPEINDNTAHFDASVVARRVCSPTLMNTTTFTSVAAIDKEITFRVYEMYGDPTPAKGAYAETTQGVFKASLTKRQWTRFTSFDYEWTWPIMTRDEKPKFMTFFPRSQRAWCGMTQQFYLMFMSNEIDLDVQIDLYDSSGSLVANDAVSTVSADGQFFLINCSPKIIVENSLITESNFDNSAYYEITLIDYEPGHESETFRIWIDRGCDQYGTHRLQFGNRLGGIDCFSFTKANTESREITHYSMEQSWGDYDADDQYVYNMQQATDMDYLTASKGNLILSTDWLSEQIQNWLVSELFESPYVFDEVYDTEDETTTYERMRVLNGKSEKEKIIKNPKFQVVVELNPGDNAMSYVT